MVTLAGEGEASLPARSEGEPVVSPRSSAAVGPALPFGAKLTGDGLDGVRAQPGWGDDGGTAGGGTLEHLKEPTTDQAEGRTSRRGAAEQAAPADGAHRRSSRHRGRQQDVEVARDELEHKTLPVLPVSCESLGP